MEPIFDCAKLLKSFAFLLVSLLRARLNHLSYESHLQDEMRITFFRRNFFKKAFLCHCQTRHVSIEFKSNLEECQYIKHVIQGIYIKGKVGSERVELDYNFRKN